MGDSEAGPKEGTGRRPKVDAWTTNNPASRAPHFRSGARWPAHPPRLRPASVPATKGWPGCQRSPWVPGQQVLSASPSSRSPCPATPRRRAPLPRRRTHRLTRRRRLPFKASLPLPPQTIRPWPPQQPLDILPAIDDQDPAASRRQHVEVRASQTGPKLPSLHALPRHGLPRFTACTAQQRRAWFSPNRIGRTAFHRQTERFPPGPQRPGFHPRTAMMTLVGHGGILDGSGRTPVNGCRAGRPAGRRRP
jgi:hypothetical protein